MKKIILKHLNKIIILGILIAVFLSFNLIFTIKKLDVDYADFLSEGTFAILAIMCFLISLDFKIKYMSLGWGTLSISIFKDALDEIKFITFPEWTDVIFEDIFFGLGILLTAYGFYKAIEEKEKMLQKLEYSAYTDSLTNLPNRRLIKVQLNLAIKQAVIKNTKLGILFIDLDRFKLVNDSLGHSIGDKLLKETANRLKAIIKKNDFVARLGGDEFIIILKDNKDISNIENTAIKIMNVFNNPFVLKKEEIHITCSIGISIFPYDGNNANVLFKYSDIAMYAAKENGRNSYEFYNSSMNDLVEKKHKITEELRKALTRNEFILHYQPKVEISTGKIIGLEALIRWNHPKRGIIYPNEFIEIAEETGIIKEIDKHSIQLACLQIKNWKDNNVIPINIAVNISAKLFNNKDFVDKLYSLISSYDINPSYLSIEITETAAIQDIDHACKILNKLKKRKIKISLDDFGKGYSSLNYLKMFPIDILKIDKSFVDGINNDKKDKVLIQAVITMSKALDIKVVSEGVENSEQLKFLSKSGCDQYQGYLFSKPVPIEEIENMLNIN